MILSCEDTSGEVHMFRAHTWELLRAGRFIAGWITRVGLQVGRSVELDYEQEGSWTTSGQVRGSIGITKTSLSMYLVLTWEAKVVCFLKIWWRLNETLLNYLEAITIGMKPTLMKERRFDDIHDDQGWNVCSPCSYIN